MALTNKLSAIGDAIRAKTGGTELLTLDEMPVAINSIEAGGGGGLTPPDSAYLLQDVVSSINNNGKWDWFFESEGKKITTKNITHFDNSFFCSGLAHIDFDFNCSSGVPYNNAASAFAACTNLREAPGFHNFIFSSATQLFYNCTNLVTLRESTLDWDTVYQNGAEDEWFFSTSMAFANCPLLKEIPSYWLRCPARAMPWQWLLYQGFMGCHSLAQLTDIELPTSQEWTENAFNESFTDCHRLKELTFKTYDQTFNWSNQYINLSTVGNHYMWEYFSWDTNHDKRVDDDAAYQALKNDPDWYTGYVEYSRYNHNSAVNTINSLPTVTGESNIIDFGTNCSARGLWTDGGAIGDLTEEEIAVAAAKGWTVAIEL